MKICKGCIALSLFYLIGTGQVVAQDTVLGENKRDIKVQKYTLMEQFEPELILSVKERIRLKEERLATIKRRRSILDTLEISNRRRQRLLKELLIHPFSDKLNRVVADIEFVGDHVEN